MAYGIQVLDVDGRTIFNSNHFCELVAFKGTAAGDGWLDIPGWCYGQDQDVANTSFSRTNTTSGVTFAHDSEIAFPWDGTSASLLAGTEKITSGSNTWLLTGLRTTGGQTWNGSAWVYTNAFQVHTTSGPITSIRNTVASRQLTPQTVYECTPIIYARPQSSSYTGTFCLQERQLTSGNSMDTTDRYNRAVRILDSGSSNTFEIVVCLSAKDWGGISGTKAHQGGASNYGIHTKGPGGQQFHSATSPTVSFTTYHSSGRPSKALTHKSVGINNSSSALQTTIGSLATSTTKRFCRMSGTRYGKNFAVSSVTREYRHHYKWTSNNSINLQWLPIPTAYNPIHPFYSGNSTLIFETYYGDHLFAVVEFGLGI